MPDDRDLQALGVLTDPQRRRVFEQLQAEPDSTVSELARRLGIGRTLVTFHLGKLLDAGFVEVVAAQRQTGLRGRPSQRYRLSGREVVASVPDRRYDLLAGVLLDALAGHRSGESAQSSAERAARRRGAELGREPAGGRAPRTTAGRFGRLERLLARLGYAPRREHGVLAVHNCPFDKLRAESTERVCAVNLALAEGYLAGLGLDAHLRARLRPCPETCCVVFEPS